MEDLNAIENCCKRAKKLDKDNVAGLNFIIDELNSLDYQTLHTNNEVAQDLLLTIMSSIPERNDHILSKFCCILQSFSHKLKVAFDGQCFDALLEFIVNSIHGCGTWVLPDVLFALSCLLFKNDRGVEKVYEKLVASKGYILQVASGNADSSAEYAAMKCLQNLTFKGNQEKFVPNLNCVKDIYSTCVSSLVRNSCDIDDMTKCKILLCSLKCIENVFALSSVSIDNLGEFLGVLKVLLYCGFPGTKISPTVLYPTLMSVHMPEQSPAQNESAKKQFQRLKHHGSRPKKKNAGRKQGEKESKTYEEEFDDHQNKDYKAGTSFTFQENSDFDQSNWGWTSSSESDFSDIEDTSLKIKSLQAKIREHAYIVFQAAVKATEKKVMFGFWSSFLPHCVSADSGISSLNIFTSILKDPSPKVRVCAIGVLSEILWGSKQFLSLVDDRAVNLKSFVSASSVLTSMVNELHRCLLLSLVSETSPRLLTQTLKCYAILIDNVPYKKLNQGLLYKLLNQVKPLLLHKDTQVQVACLTVFASVLSSDQVPNDVCNNLIHFYKYVGEIANEPTQKAASINLTNTSSNEESSDSNLPWLVAICRNNIVNGSHTMSLPVLVKSLQVLCVISGKFFDITRPFIPLFAEIILMCLQDGQPFLQLHGAKLLEVIGRGLLNVVESKASTVPACSSSLRNDDVDEDMYCLWHSILNGPFPSCLTNTEQPALRATCCDCLSTLPFQVFNKLNKKIQIFCITLLFGLSSDSDHNVRGAAVRCVGIYSLFPCLREDLYFLSDAAGILVKAVSDPILTVKIKASWALGNLTDALSLSKEEYPDFYGKVTSSFIYSIGMASVQAAEDSDRVRSSAVRALGNLLHFLHMPLLENSQIKEFIKKAYEAILSALSAKVMKVCWNACYALRNIFISEDLVSSGLLDLEKALKALILVLKSPNFKVRINGVLALAALPGRDLYGDLFPTVFNHLIETLFSAQADVDFKELKHFENLNDMVSYSLCQLLCLVNKPDLNMLHKHGLDAGELLLKSMWKFGQRTTEDKIAVVCTASEHLVRLTKEHPEQSQVLEHWLSVLSQAKTSFAEEPPD